MPRSNRYNFLLRWWWSIDSLMFALILTLIAIGAFLTATASPSVAMKIGASAFHFIYKQLIFLSISLFIIITLSLMSKRAIKRIALIGFICTLILMILVLFIGDEAKGAKRWINIMFFSLQPSEILKPFYAIVTALILSSNHDQKKLFNLQTFNIYFCLGMHMIVCILLLMQPDFGMAMTISIVTVGQLFVAGLPILWILILSSLFVVSIVMAYNMFPHVNHRINNFLGAENSLSYQVEKSIESYANGGIFGKGPGEGSVKFTLPDSHTDFIFAVAAEEMGAIFCTIIIIIFAAILVIAMMRISILKDLFSIYSIVGLILYLAIQSIFNIGVTLHLFPTKGMTLPFISYGGSSTFSFAIAMGIYFSLTKKIIAYRSYIKN